MTKVTEARTVTALGAKAAIKQCFNAKRPVFIWGPPGIGKSELLAEIAGEMQGLLIDLRMPLLEPTDLRGIPFYNKELNKMDWAAPIDLPDEDLASKYPVVVLFLDEMNAAAPAVQASGYQLILNRRIGKYVLPDNVVIVAAGNRESDKGVTFRMPSPLANRFIHLEMRVDFDSWLEWAVKNNVSEDIVGYLSHHKSHLFDFDPKSPSRSFATPRSWKFVDDLLGSEGKMGNDVLTDLVSGTVGEGTALAFMAHRKLTGQLPLAIDVLTGKETELRIKEISAQYSMVISMCYELKDQYGKLVKDKKVADWYKMADNFFKFMMANFNTELVVMGARVALTTYALPIEPNKLTTFNEFHKRYGKYVVAASQ